MALLIDGVVEMLLKNDVKALRFNVLYQPLPDQVEACIAVPGFRLIHGDLLPPAAHGKGSRWYPTVYLGRQLAGEIYDALKQVLIEKELRGKYPLNPRIISIEPLTDHHAMYRLFPSTVGENDTDPTE